MSRRIDRIRTACTLTVSPTSWRVPARAPEACAVAVPPPAPEFFEPVAPPDPEVELLVPAPLTLHNADYQLNCSDIAEAGPHGDPVQVLAGTVSGALQWTDVTDITDAQMDTIARLTEDKLILLTGSDVVAADVMTITGLNRPQSEEVTAALAALRTSIQEETALLALSNIRCVFRNQVQSVDCPSPAHALTGSSPAASGAGVLNPSVVPDGTYESEASQASADALARLEASRRLVCLFGNDALALTCQDIGYPTAIPTDSVALSRDGRLRVGATQVDAGVFFAGSKAEANDLARAAAVAQLSCFYLNEPTVVTCADKSPDLAEAATRPIDYDTLLPGNPVTVQAGRFLSEGSSASQAGANQAARQAAIALLECVFQNTRQVVKCQPVSLDGGVTFLPPQDGVSEVVVEAGTFQGSTQAEADALAREVGLLQLGCRYCNSFIAPSCYPPDYTPVPGQAIPSADVTSDWSTDVILGLTAGTICTEVPEQVMPLAQAVAIRRPIILKEGCLYVNDEMWFGCLLDLPAPAVPPPGGYHHPAYPGNGVMPPGYDDYPFEQQLSPNSSPKPSLGASSYIVVPAGSWPINSRDVPVGMTPKQYANDQARLYGLMQLRCSFANPELSLNCNTAFDGRFNQAEVAQSDGQVVTVTIPAARHESYFSFREAWMAAQSEARALLDCHYENPKLLVRCWSSYGQPGSYPSLQPPPATSGTVRVYGDGQARRFWTVGGVDYDELVTLKNWQSGSVGTPVLVPRGSFISLTSAADALRQALDYAVASLDCTAQAQDVSVCNDPMVIFCGGLSEPSPGRPYSPGVNQPTDKWSTVDGLIRAGDGHNYVVSGFNSTTNTPTLLDLGCSDDPIGGCSGPGLRIPACFTRAATQEEANLMAYQLMRGRLSCGSNVQPPDIAGAAGAPGASGPQTGCSGQCLAVYA